MLSDRPEYDESYSKTRVYIANTRNHLYNLKTHYHIDLMNESNSAHNILSNVIFSKFSQELRQAFSWELKTHYPTFKQILDSYCRVITSVGHNKKSKPVSKPSNPSGGSRSQGSKQVQSYNSRSNYKYKTEPNFSAQARTISASFLTEC